MEWAFGVTPLGGDKPARGMTDSSGGPPPPPGPDAVPHSVPASRLNIWNRLS